MKKNWENIDWTKVHLMVYDLQCKIFKASVNISVGKIRHYQQTLVKCHEAKLLAVRKITQDNNIWTKEFQFMHGHCHDKIHGEKK